MAQYHHEHTSGWNRFLHIVGIPILFAGIAVLFFGMWRTGIAFFVTGWVLLLLGHRIEGNRPAFFQGPVYFLVGPLWVAKEVWNWLTGGDRKPNAT
jgi:hypothetical protein